MIRTVQKRTLATRARLIEAATSVVAEKGYEALRVEEVVQRAGVAKGTFFAHFADKDALMDLLIGERIDQFLDELEVALPLSMLPGWSKTWHRFSTSQPVRDTFST
jgi:AcrR family transcriptional regulator